MVPLHVHSQLKHHCSGIRCSDASLGFGVPTAVEHIFAPTEPPALSPPGRLGGDPPTPPKLPVGAAPWPPSLLTCERWRWPVVSPNKAAVRSPLVPPLPLPFLYPTLLCSMVVGGRSAGTGHPRSPRPDPGASYLDPCTGSRTARPGGVFFGNEASRRSRSGVLGAGSALSLAGPSTGAVTPARGRFGHGGMPAVCREPFLWRPGHPAGCPPHG